MRNPVAILGLCVAAGGACDADPEPLGNAHPTSAWMRPTLASPSTDPTTASQGNGHGGDQGCGVDVTGWTLAWDDGSTVLDGAIVDARGYVIVTAGATREELESHWDVSLPSNVLVHAAQGWSPGAAFTLQNGGGVVLDGPTHPYPAGKNSSRRGMSPPDRANAWHVRPTHRATPGDGLSAGPHVRISEIADVAGGDPPTVAYVELFVGGFGSACEVVAPEDPDHGDSTGGEPQGPEPASCDTDADCIDDPAGPACHPFGHFCGVDISDWGVVQSNTQRTRYFATPTVVPAGTVVLLSRAGTTAQFEAHWGVSLGANALHVTTDGMFPAIDGDETFLVQAPGFITFDGPTPPISAGTALELADGSWSLADPTPGTAACPPQGLWLTEIADTAAAGYGDYEYVELCAGAP